MPSDGNLLLKAVTLWMTVTLQLHYVDSLESPVMYGHSVTFNGYLIILFHFVFA